MFTPLSVLAFSTLPQALRTDGAGLYNLMRQLGCAVGVAIVVSVLAAAVDWNYTGLLAQLDACAPSGCALDGMGPNDLMQRATFSGYLDDFHVMALAVIATLPLLLVLRTSQDARAAAAAAAD
jgi:DHA2 family multidrug resistance protein